MGHREVRRVPLNWKHPQEGIYHNGRTRYRPLHARSRLLDLDRWNAENPDLAEDDAYGPDDYMPEFPEGTPMGYQLYETTTEGTPVSPVFTTPEDLAAWCEHCATVFARSTWTKEQWLRSFRDGTTAVASLGNIGPSGIAPADPLTMKETRP